MNREFIILFANLTGNPDTLGNKLMHWYIMLLIQNGYINAGKRMKEISLVINLILALFRQRLTWAK